MYTNKVFYIQEKTSTVMSGAKRKVCCRELLRKVNILPLPREFLTLHYVLWTWIIHVLSNKYQKGVYYSGIELFSSISSTISRLNHDIKVFNLALSIYYLSHFTLYMNLPQIKVLNCFKKRQ